MSETSFNPQAFLTWMCNVQGLADDKDLGRVLGVDAETLRKAFDHGWTPTRYLDETYPAHQDKEKPA